MKLIAAAFVLLVLIGIAISCVYFAGLAVNIIRKRGQRHSPWRLDTYSDASWVYLRVVKPYENPIEIGKVRFSADDFDMQMYELRAEANEKIYALNNDRALSKGKFSSRWTD